MTPQVLPEAYVFLASVLTKASEVSLRPSFPQPTSLVHDTSLRCKVAASMAMPKVLCRHWIRRDRILAFRRELESASPAPLCRHVSPGIYFEILAICAPRCAGLPAWFSRHLQRLVRSSIFDGRSPFSRCHRLRTSFTSLFWMRREHEKAPPVCYG
jgi:hypothetical protein